MKFIAHRGNINGRNVSEENKPEYIKKAIESGYEAEVDVWYVRKNFYLGHDKPVYKVHYQFFYNSKLWVHAKNIEALEKLHYVNNCFFHDKDKATLTSKNKIWVYPGEPLVEGCVTLLFGTTTDYSMRKIRKCFAVCTDDILYWKKKI